MQSNHLATPFSFCFQSFPTSGFFVLFCFVLFFQWGSSLHQWPKYWSFSFSISPSNEYSGLTSFRIDRFDLLAVQGTLKSLLQKRNSKASVLQCSAFFMVQISHPYMITRKIITLTIHQQSDVSTFNLVSRFVTASLPRTQKFFLISCLNRFLAFWLWSSVISCPQSPSAGDIGDQGNKICHCFQIFPFYLSWSDRTGCHDLCCLNVQF